MNNQKDGGPAFPMQFLGISRGALSYEDTDNQEGMTLRDYFAASALAGLLTDSGCAVAEKLAAEKGVTPTQSVAWAAYDIADAMLEARKQ